MILKKPYAFLIKNFRIIHGIIFTMLIYLLIKSVNIYSFFNDYATKHYFTLIANLTNNYINIMMFVIAFLVVILGFIVYYLLSIKNKNRKTYFFICFYYIVISIYFIYIRSVLNGLQNGALSTETVRLLRDISLISILPQVIFLFIILARTLGFNLKQFEFKNDLQDLKIDESDYEEVEVSLGKNNYIYARFFRKTFRYLKYFILENKFFVTIIASVILISIGVLFYMNIKVTNVVYFENESIYANTLWYTIEKTYLTNKSINGSIIKKDKSYIIVNVNMENKTSNKYDLSRLLFRLEVNGELLIPQFTMDKEFLDLGNLYVPMQISENESKKVIVVFEINNSDIKDEYIFKIKKNENVKISAEDKQYKDVIIKPINIDKDEEEKTCNIPCDIDFKESNLKESELKVDYYKIAKSFKEDSTYCLNGKCYNKIIFIEPSTNNYSILKIKASMKIDENINMNLYLKNPAYLVEYYGLIKYRTIDGTYESFLTKIVNNNISNSYYYFEVPNDILSADKISLILNIREKTYIIVLK